VTPIAGARRHNDAELVHLGVDGPANILRYGHLFGLKTDKACLGPLHTSGGGRCPKEPNECRHEPATSGHRPFVRPLLPWRGGSGEARRGPVIAARAPGGQGSRAVPGRAPRSPGPVHYVSRAASTKRRDERLRPAEVALFEVLRDWNALVEVSTHDAVDRIARLADNGTVRLDRLARASETEPPRVRERLRRLFGALGRPALLDTVRPARSESVHHDLALTG